MEIERELGSVSPQKETIVTIGVFDGVHAGHRYLLEKLRRQATDRSLLSAVVTFDPHPQSVLHSNKPLAHLSNLEDRIATLREIGIDIVAVLTFSPEVAQLSARQFISLVKKQLRMRHLIVGPDFTLGRDRRGNAHFLRALGRQMGFNVEITLPYTVNGEVVSSTLIRQALARGDMEKVRRLMGHYFCLAGKTITSDKRGRVLGFPTANLHTKSQQALPANGVYATLTYVDGKGFPSATNIGIRPTFGGRKKLLETHLLDYDGDLQGIEIKVEFVRKLRDEQRFPSPEELKAQIAEDVREVEAVFAKGLK
jgi:riboflavin kinase/FMN adenylyltransferase